jgi:hypothetical protein
MSGPRSPLRYLPIAFWLLVTSWLAWYTKIQPCALLCKDAWGLATLAKELQRRWLGGKLAETRPSVTGDDGFFIENFCNETPREAPETGLPGHHRIVRSGEHCSRWVHAVRTARTSRRASL